MWWSQGISNQARSEARAGAEAASDQSIGSKG
jgi:hypothetical protein